ncbi:MAG: cyclic nucleotide-binding domain-containing protein [Xenococcaceae cyanobacterium]
MSQTLLQELRNSDIDWLMATGKRRKVDADRLLLKAGKPIASFYLLIDGSLTVSVSQSHGHALNRAFAALEDKTTLERDIIELHNGDIAGEEVLVSTRVAATNVRTKLPSEVLMIPQAQLQAKLQQDIGFAARFYLGIARLLTNRLLNLKPQLRTKRLNSPATQSREVLFAFGKLHDSDIDWLIANGNCQYLPADTMLLQEGRPAENLYLLLKGLAKVSIAEAVINPLDLAFVALGTSNNRSLGKEIATVRPGEFIGEMPFGDTRLASSSVCTVEDSLVLAIPERSLKLKLQQDLGWTARFESVVATLAAERFRDTISRLGYGRNFYSSGQALEDSGSYEDELNADSLDRLNLAGSRFKWMLDRLQVLGNKNGRSGKQLANSNSAGI